MLEASMDNPQSEKLPGAFELFGPSWAAVKLNWRPIFLPSVFALVGAAIATLIIYLGASQLHGSGFSEAVRLILIVIGSAIGLISFAGLIVFSSATATYAKMLGAQGERVEIEPAIRRSLPFFWRLLGLGVLRFIIILAGFICLIVPGFFLWKRYLLAPYYLVDQDISIREAMKRAAADSKPFSSALWGLVGIGFLIEFLGIVPIVGGFFSAALNFMYSCAVPIRYFQVKQAKKSS